MSGNGASELGLRLIPVLQKAEDAFRRETPPPPRPVLVGSHEDSTMQSPVDGHVRDLHPYDPIEEGLRHQHVMHGMHRVREALDSSPELEDLATKIVQVIARIGPHKVLGWAGMPSEMKAKLNEMSGLKKRVREMTYEAIKDLCLADWNQRRKEILHEAVEDLESQRTILLSKAGIGNLGTSLEVGEMIHLPCGVNVLNPTGETVAMYRDSGVGLGTPWIGCKVTTTKETTLDDLHTHGPIEDLVAVIRRFVSAARLLTGVDVWFTDIESRARVWELLRLTSRLQSPCRREVPRKGRWTFNPTRGQLERIGRLTSQMEKLDKRLQLAAEWFDRSINEFGDQNRLISLCIALETLSKPPQRLRKRKHIRDWILQQTKSEALATYAEDGYEVRNFIIHEGGFDQKSATTLRLRAWKPDDDLVNLGHLVEKSFRFSFLSILNEVPFDPIERT